MNIYDENFKEKSRLCKEELARIDAKIAQREQQIKRLEKKRSKVWNSFSWHTDVVERLMHDLERETGLHGEIYGPFGIRAETSIYLRADMSKSICDQETLSIELEHFEDGTRYWNGEVKGNYPPGSIGWMNNCGHVMVPLPDTLEEIIGVLRKTGTTEKEE